MLLKAAAKDRNMKYDFCVESLESNPHSKSATSIKGLDYRRANEYLISAFDAPRICEDIFTKIKKAKSPIRDENNNII
ncbi:unnamed protein product [Thlaspi arvense]|uniref:Pectinesterase inhibitor domain-containing protein n=1 Tax=Thlaspi arvense TaxID=13288 RepID=A0AAU9RDC1_THLAR|nr:unnamed protein product [Thlaspi arvense]